MPNIYLWREEYVLGCEPTQIRDFPYISYSIRSLLCRSKLVRQCVRKDFDTEYQFLFYLWWVKPVFKLLQSSKLFWRRFDLILIREGTFIKYAGLRGQVGKRFFQDFSKTKFIAQRTIEVRNSSSSNLFEKRFLVPSINFNFFFKACIRTNKNKQKVIIGVAFPVIFQALEKLLLTIAFKQ